MEDKGQQAKTVEQNDRAGLLCGSRPTGIYETSRDSWHTAAIHGHSHFSKIFPSTVGEGDLLKEQNLYMISQLLEG
jgi:hypothetical protein